MDNSPPIDRRAAEDEVLRIVRAARTSFYWGMRRLPPERRIVMFAVYAFCRVVDDIADGPGDLAAKRARLAEWRAEIDRLHAGCPGRAETIALADGVARFGLRREDFLAVIEGMEMDARPRVRIADDAELTLYCDRVAGAVGRLSNRVFGLDGAAADELAATLGEALQLTNILRDVAEDAAIDRVYLPADRLRAAGVAADDARAILAHPGTGRVCADLAARARTRFAQARARLATHDRERVRPAAMMMAVYSRIFARLEARGWDRFAERVGLSAAEKLWIALRHGVL